MKVTQPPFGTPINRSHPLSQGMVGCWLLNDKGGKKAVDSTKLSRTDGTLTGTSIAYVPTIEGIAVNTSASNYVLLGTPSNLELATSQITISAWIYTTSLAATQSFFASCNAGATAYPFRFSINTFGGLNFSHQPSTPSFTLSSPTGSIVVNNWYHVVVVRTGTTGAWGGVIYTNGLARTTTASNITVNPGVLQTTCIGVFGGSLAQPLVGNINNVMIWNRALTATEVRSLYTNTYQMFK